jgi:hypothetical protein
VRSKFFGEGYASTFSVYTFDGACGGSLNSCELIPSHREYGCHVFDVPLGRYQPCPFDLRDDYISSPR